MNFSGPTAERLIHADGYLDIGDDKRGTRIYHMLDSCLDRTYADLRRKAGGAEENTLRVEYVALKKFHVDFNEGGMVGSVGSVDFNREGVSGNSRSFLATTERQVKARQAIADAKQTLSVGQWVVVSNVVLNDHSLELAGYAIGRKSKTRAFEAARIVLRGAGQALAGLWGIK